ncbi:UPF0342 protein [Clostridium polyendosporum]|uniref:UPF0342 protein n=1 Tax=Clostridium polyendosporum TaxID=69208 RepID=A0A919RYJ2_9CLOT|nr:YlbF family regulator [Clostridium polyendosporum]GIM27913.1 UPF0342 protein [Clostridium polyendosporum]
MANIYDKAHEFAKELKNLPEVIEYRNASKKINEDDKHRKMVEDFRKIQIQAYTEQMQNNGNISDTTKEKFKNIGSIVMMNPEIAQYLQAEAKFAVIWDDLLKILNDAIGVEQIVPDSK